MRYITCHSLFFSFLTPIEIVTKIRNDHQNFIRITLINKSIMKIFSNFITERLIYNSIKLGKKSTELSVHRIRSLCSVISQSYLNVNETLVHIFSNYTPQRNVLSTHFTLIPALALTHPYCSRQKFVYWCRHVNYARMNGSFCLTMIWWLCLISASCSHQFCRE